MSALTPLTPSPDAWHGAAIWVEDLGDSDDRSARPSFALPSFWFGAIATAS